MQRAEDFFRVFAERVNTEDFSAIARLFNYPVSIAYVDPTKVYNSPSEIAEVMRAQIGEYRKAGAASISVRVVTDTRIETGTHFVDVVWSFNDQNDQRLFDYPASYALREDEQGYLKAIMFAGHDAEECRDYLRLCPDGRPIGVARR